MNPRATHAALPLIEALFDGTIDDAGFVRLEAFLRDDVEARAIYRSMANLHATLPSIVNQIPRLSISLTDSDGDSLLEPHEMPHDQLMALIAQVESKGEDLDPMVLAAERFPVEPKHSPTKQDWAMAGAYLLGQAKQYRQQMIMGAVAAVILLAAVLFLTLGGPDDSSSIAGVPPIERPSTELAPETRVPVASLSAQQDALWQDDFDYGTPEAGEALYAGRRLTLLDGFAEITTSRDATIVLQAPCTVEMIDSPNAIRLISGKLVGYVGSDRAKGLLVRTPQMDITDLGTRFGVSCRADGTALRVFEGEVLAAAVQASSADEQVVVAAGESVIAPMDASRIERVDQTADRYVTTLQAVANAPALTGNIRYEPSMPSDLRVGGYERSEIRLFKEAVGVALPDPIAVNIIGPGRYENDDLQLPVTLNPTAVDSYLIHLDTLPLDGGGRTHRATIRFDRAIVGIVTSSQAMADSHQLLGLPDVRYGTMSEGNSGRYTGLDKSTEQQQETVEISDDGHTLTLQLSTGGGIDQIRVLIASQLSL